MEDVIRFLRERENLGIKFGLERMNVLLDRLGSPERKVPMIHVAGTNGKGSTVEMIARSLMAHGKKIGVFTSPSFYGYRGHVFINDDMMSEETFIRLMHQLLPVINDLDRQGEAPTSFEILTAIAFSYFPDRVDMAIIEAGMGGRFDTTNCIDPVISVITSVAIDHEQFLGSSLEAISHHKAGIIKRNRPVIVGPLASEAKTVIEKEAEKQQAKLFSYGEDFRVEKRGDGYLWFDKDGFQIPFTLNLKGKHQVENAAVAIMVLNYLERFESFPIDWRLVAKTLRDVRIPGRFEAIGSRPTIILDSAHNVKAIEAFIETAKPYFEQKRARLLFAGFKDKRLAEMIERLIKEDIDLTVTTFQHPRAAEKSFYTELLSKHPTLKFVDDWKKEIRSFLTDAAPEEVMFVTGSLHFTMFVRHWLTTNTQKQSKQP